LIPLCHEERAGGCILLSIIRQSMMPIIFGIQFYFATKPASPANAHAFAGDAGYGSRAVR